MLTERINPDQKTIFEKVKSLDYILILIILIIGIIKVALAVLLFSGVFYKKLTLFSASGIAIMMLAAAYFHFSVGDELIKALPSSVMLLSCLIIIYSSLKK